MKLIILLIFLSSCSHQSWIGKTTPARNVLQKESYQRHPTSALNKIYDKENEISKALIECYKGNVNDGLKRLNLITIKNIKNNMLWLAKGNCYFQREDYKKAMFFYNLSSSNTKGNFFAPSQNNIAAIYIKNKNYHKAEIILEEIVKRKKRLLTPQFNLGIIYLKFNKYKKAQRIFTKLQKINSKDYDVSKLLGQVHLFSGEYQMAIKELNQIPDEMVDGQVYLSLAYLKNNELSKSKDIADKTDFSGYPEFKKVIEIIRKHVGRKLASIREKEAK